MRTRTRARARTNEHQYYHYYSLKKRVFFVIVSHIKRKEEEKRKGHFSRDIYRKERPRTYPREREREHQIMNTENAPLLATTTTSALESSSNNNNKRRDDDAGNERQEERRTVFRASSSFTVLPSLKHFGFGFVCTCALLVLGSATLSSSRAQKMTVSSSLGGHKGYSAPAIANGGGNTVGNFKDVAAGLLGNDHYESLGKKHLTNEEGEIKGLVKHVNKLVSASGGSKFRIITFCNHQYWFFANLMMLSLKNVAPGVLPYWTIVVADDQTKAYIQEQAKEYPIDIFVDKSLHDALHKGSKNADADELKSMLSWRRVHALYTLVNADYTAVFLEPDVVFTGNPMQTIHDQLLDHDVVVSSDYGFKSAAKKTVNTKMIMAKPSKEAKKLLNVWQKAEASYRGEDAERGFLEEHVIPKLSELSAKIGVADQSVVQNYITHINKKKDKNTAFFVTGTGCPDVNFKLNFLNQISQLVMPISSSVQMTVDYESVAEGCDVETRKKILGLRHDANSAA